MQKFLRISALAALAFGLESGHLAFAQAGTHYGSQTAITTTSNGNTAFEGVAADAAGDVYIVDTGNNVVYEQTLSAGVYTQTTVLNATNNGLKVPIGIAVDSSGNLYVADSLNERLLKETLGSGGTYTQTVIVQNSGGSFVNPFGVAVDSSGNVYASAEAYISSAYVSQVYKFTPNGSTYTQSTVVGSGLSEANGVAVDTSGNVYIADSGNTRVLKETLSSGTYTQSVVVDDSTFNWLDGIIGLAVDSSGDVFVTNGNTSGYDANTVVEAVLSGGTYHMRLVGIGFSQPYGVALDGTGNLYVTANSFTTIDKISYPSTNFGSVNVGSTSSAMTLPFTVAAFNGSLSGLTLSMGAASEFTNTGTGTCDTNGSHLYTAGTTCTVSVTFSPQFAGLRSGILELVNSSNVMVAEQYITGIGNGPQAAFAPGTQTTIGTSLSAPTGVAVDGNGKIYIADTGNNTIFTETPSGSTYTQSSSGINTSGTTLLGGAAVDGADNVYFASNLSGASTVYQSEPIASVGYQGNIAANNGEGSALSSPQSLAVDNAGNLYIADTANNRIVEELYSSGSTYNQPVTWQINVANTGLSGPQGVAVDGSGNVYVADTGNNRILEEKPTGLGLFTQSVVVSSGLSAPSGLAVDDIGNLYISDTGNKRVLMETVSSGVFTQSVLLSTGLSTPKGLALDARGNVYIADSGNKDIVKLNLGAAPSLTFASTTVGSTSSDSPQTVTLENLGTTALTFPIPGTGSDPSISASFTLNSTGGTACPLLTTSSSTVAMLAANARCTMPISFTPITSGTISGSLIVTDNNLNVSAATQTITLNGSGAAAASATLGPTPSSFGNQTLTYTSATSMVVVLTNNGGITLTGITVSVTGTNASAFGETSTCGTTLAPLATCNISVNFTPTVLGTNTASLSVADNAPNSPQTVALTGIGTTATVVAPEPLVFSPYVVGTTATSTMTATFQVNGYPAGFTPTAKLHYGTSFFPGAMSCTGTANSETCSLAVSFQPLYPGGRHDAIFLMNGSTRIASVLLYGIGQAPFAMVQPGVVTDPILNASNYNYASVVDENGTAYVLQTGANAVLSITKAGVVTTLPITGLNSPRDLGIDGAGILYIADQTPHGPTITYDTVQGLQSSVAFPSGSFYIQGLAVGNTGNIYETDYTYIYTVPISGTGTAATTAISPNNAVASQLIIDSNEDIFVGGNAINEITYGGTQTQVNTDGASEGIGVDAAGTLYATRYTGTVGVAELPATDYATFEAALDPAAEGPLGVSVGPDGTLYVGNYTNVDKIDRSQGAIAFGQISAVASQNVSLYNGGNQPLTISNIAIAGTGFTFAPATTNPCTLNVAMAPGTLCQVTVTLTAPHPGTYTGTLTFTNNSLNSSISTQTVALSGAEYGIFITTSPSSLNFNNQTVGTTSAAQTITLTNVGELYNASLGAITGTGPFNFGVGTCTSALPPGASCQLSVTFAPTTTTAYNNTSIGLAATSSGGGPANSFSVTVSGTGTAATAPSAALAPNPLTFPGTTVGTSATTLPMTLSNSGTAALTISSISVTGTNATSFSQTNNCGPSVAIGGSCTITVTFTPAVTGSLAASITIADNATGSPQSAAVTGTGTAALVAQAVLSPNPLAFPSTTVGTSATTLPMTLSNPGTAALTISSISITGTNASSFSQTNNCGSSVAIGGSCTINVTFTPASAAALTASVSVTDTATGSPQSITLTGTGTAALVAQAVFSPNTLAFPSTTVGTAATAVPITLSNPGTAALTISSISITGTNASSFSQTNNCGSSLAIGGSCIINVTFTPASAAALTASVSVTDTATGSPQSITLTGTGTAALVAQAVLSPNTLAFPSTTVGTAATTVPITLSNPGTAALTISSISITGTNASSFSQTNNCGSSLAIGGSCTINVTFTPAATGSLSAAISVADNASGSPQSAAIIGAGASVVTVGTFTVGTSTPTATVQPGGIAQFNLLVAPLGGTYNNLVTLSATGLPAGAQVSFQPAAVIPGSAGAPSVMSIQTSTGLAHLNLPDQHRNSPVPLLAMLAGLPLLGFAGNLRRLRRCRGGWMLLGLATLAILPLLALSGCGGGYFGPAQKTYAVTVTGTSGALQQSTTISLTVQ